MRDYAGAQQLQLIFHGCALCGVEIELRRQVFDRPVGVLRRLEIGQGPLLVLNGIGPLRQTPHASTSKSTWFSRGTGFGTESSASGEPAV